MPGADGDETGQNSTGFLDQLRTGGLRDVLFIMERLGDSGAGFRSLAEAID